MRIAIASFSFHRTMAAGKQDMFRYITDSKSLGCTQLDPWNAHLSAAGAGQAAVAARDPREARVTPADDAFIDRVKEAAKKAGLPFGCIAADGAVIYDADEGKRAANRQRAYRWLDIAHRLGAAQIRIDAGGPADMPDDVFRVILDGYADVIGRARDLGIQVLTENHFGPSPDPDHLQRLLDNVEGLGLLLDSNNWAPGRQVEGWERFAGRADSTHFKTYQFDENGLDPSVDLVHLISLLKETGYEGCWGVESVPRDGDEYAGARKTIEMLRRYVEDDAAAGTE